MGHAKRFFMVMLWTILLIPSSVWAAHPLITDDAGTQGKEKFQFEVNGQYDSDRETAGGVSKKTTGGEAAVSFSYGIFDNADLVFSLPYVWGKDTVNGVNTYDEKGIGDAGIEVKYRVFEKDGFSLAVKPGISFSTGNEDKGLGTGKTGYHVFVIGSKEAAPWGFHANLGYIRNENKAGEEPNLWHVSLATTYEVARDLKLVGNLGMEKNPDKAADNDPAFLIGGVIYSVAGNFDIDFGVKYGLSSSETDMSLMAGTAYRF